MKMISLSFISLFILGCFRNVNGAYYLPGVTPNSFDKGEAVRFSFSTSHILYFFLYIFNINNLCLAHCNLYLYDRFLYKLIKLHRHILHFNMIIMIYHFAREENLR